MFTRNRTRSRSRGNGHTDAPVRWRAPGVAAGAPRGRRARRRASVAPVPRPPLVPATVVVHPDALRTIAAACAASGDDETGGPLFGTVARTWNGPQGGFLVAVLGTPPPGPALDGRRASVTLGEGSDGERERAALRWWRGVSGLDLVHVGEWHKHPSGMPQPSAGDCATAHDLQRDAMTPVWIEAVAVGEVDVTERVVGEGQVARVNRGHGDKVEVRWFRADGAGGLVPQTMRAEGVALPGLPALPWSVRDPARFAAECRLLDAGGITVQVAPSAPGDPVGLTLRVCRAGRGALTVHTGPEYPRAAPTIVDEEGRNRPLRGAWSSERFLIDAVRDVG